jgi:hypothetical protein
MKLKILILVLIALSTLCYADDGGYEVVGDTFHPINITDVSMDYERLILYRHNGRWEIDVYIELNNQTNRVMEPLLGFEFKCENGPGDDFSSDEFKQYILTVNGEPQKFRLITEGERGWTGTLLYTPKLLPGINKVYHNYTLSEGYGSLNGYLAYVLKTGGRWKGGVIKDLEIIIRSDAPGVLQPIFPDGQWPNTATDVWNFDLIGQYKIYNRLVQ